MSALQVDSLASGVGCDEYLHIRVVPEGFLCLHPLLAPHAAVDPDNCFPTAEERGDALHQIVQRVAVLGKDDELLARRRCGWGDRARTVERPVLRDLARNGLWREDFGEELRQFSPLRVRLAATAAHGKRHCLQ